MAKNKLTEYDSTAANNTDVGGVNLAENSMLPSDVNNALREILSHLREFADGTSGINVLSLIDDDDSHAIKIQGPSSITANTTFTLPDGDGSANQYLKTDGSGTLAWVSPSSFSLPAGLVFPYAGTSAPSGYLLCDGSAVSRSTYSTLFTAVATTYGTGDGSSTFNLPDLRGRVIAGQDDMGGASANRLTNQTGGLDGDTLGATGGSETHTLTTAQLAAHTHGAGTYVANTTRRVGGGGSGSHVDMSDAASNTAQTFSVSGTSGSAGSGAAHNNVQPTIILNYIISTGS